MDSTTRRVSEMYERFPYPSPETGRKKLKELSNLLTIFARETGYDFRGKRVLDAGTGTGHRLLEAASTLRDSTFLAVDISEKPLAIARATAQEEGIQNVDFRQCDLMADNVELGTFDVILCMGVLHHLADAKEGLTHLVGRLAPDGILFFYVYGVHGSHERMRRKQIVSLLRGADSEDFDRGIRIIKDLKFDSFSYGWNLNIDDEKTKDSLFVDSCLNVHEQLFDADSIIELVRGSGLAGFMTYGITVEQSGYLFEADLEATPDILLQRTELASKLPTPLLVERYQALSLDDRYRLIDRLYQPNGYTVIGLTQGSEALFRPSSRVLRNEIRVR